MVKEKMSWKGSDVGENESYLRKRDDQIVAYAAS